MNQSTPESVALVADFVNTRDLEDGSDTIDSPRALRAWTLKRMNVRVRALDEDDWGEAVRVREALREVLDSHGAERLDRGVLRTLNRAGAAARVGVRWEDDGAASFAPTNAGVGSVLGPIFAAIVTAQGDGTWERLKICPSEDCRAAFYDHSKNHSGKWCTMRVCGNRAKTRAYRERHESE
ncbi:MAG: CGNR zinc finger domain-containing protein [Actinomycetota bacterium]